MIDRRALLTLIGASALSACGGEEPAYEPKFAAGGEKAGGQGYTFGVLPLLAPQTLEKMYGPLVKHVNGRLDGAKLRLVASRSYEAYDQRLAAAEFDFALPNPYQTLQARERGYRVFGKMGDDDRFRGLIVVRRDSGIRSVEDLKGKTVSYPARTALAATMMPQYFLQTQGLDVARDTRSRYAGSQESSIRSVFLKASDASASWPISWDVYAREHPAEAAELEVRWRTEPLVNNSLMVHESVPAALAKRVGEVLFSLHDSEEGKRLLQAIGVSRLEPADAETYRRVEDFLRAFESTFGFVGGVPAR